MRHQVLRKGRSKKKAENKMFYGDFKYSFNSLIAHSGGHEDPQRRNSQGPSSTGTHCPVGPSMMTFPPHSGFQDAQESTPRCVSRSVNTRSRAEGGKATHTQGSLRTQRDAFCPEL